MERRYTFHKQLDQARTIEKNDGVTFYEEVPSPKESRTILSIYAQNL